MHAEKMEIFYGLLSHIKITRTLNDKTNLFVSMQMLQKRIFDKFDLGWVIFEGGDGKGFGLTYFCEEVFQLVLVVGKTLLGTGDLEMKGKSWVFSFLEIPGPSWSKTSVPTSPHLHRSIPSFPAIHSTLHRSRKSPHSTENK